MCIAEVTVSAITNGLSVFQNSNNIKYEFDYEWFVCFPKF